MRVYLEKMSEGRRKSSSRQKLLEKGERSITWDVH